jgi:hypothetical protein
MAKSDDLAGVSMTPEAEAALAKAIAKKGSENTTVASASVATESTAVPSVETINGLTVRNF